MAAGLAGAEEIADLRATAAALRRAASALGECGSAWRLALVASRLDREADLLEAAP